ncbi:hypothetical protein A3D77_03035 [Candidatus Gottesmanbacteria bacterium RIFCSPHIGHO2_02_FULL_39_11]|uniref:Uncharacterized protein n=1 Tax=Candidatus Gottesmanbacteria bacterium RIFCSPHIGHO2_02_FULL_39_11 TaxID=1798382 RepID=A0A1F5ZLZ8_9BACT|nr:MAG: hypothetical protein A3D77_03035 [Candidatus Gottesmanbacteria bacterium RIFCSPHIGHO2_02_FULL_39_11]
MNTPEGSFSHYPHIYWIDKPVSQPLFTFSGWSICDLYPSPQGHMLMKEGIYKNEGRNVRTWTYHSERIKVEKSNIAYGTDEKEMLDVMVATQSGKLMTFDIIQIGSEVSADPVTYNPYMRIRPMIGYIENSDNKEYGDTIWKRREEGWDEERGVFYLSGYEENSMRVYVPSIEYGFRRQEKGIVHRGMIKFLIGGEESSRITIDNCIEIYGINSGMVEGSKIFLEEEITVPIGEKIVGGDTTISFEGDGSIIHLSFRDNNLPLFMQVCLPEYRINYWNELFRALSTNISERPHALHNLLKSWDTSIPILEPRY